MIIKKRQEIRNSRNYEIRQSGDSTNFSHSECARRQHRRRIQKTHPDKTNSQSTDQDLHRPVARQLKNLNLLIQSMSTAHRLNLVPRASTRASSNTAATSLDTGILVIKNNDDYDSHSSILTKTQRKIIQNSSLWGPHILMFIFLALIFGLLLKAVLPEPQAGGWIVNGLPNMTLDHQQSYLEIAKLWHLTSDTKLDAIPAKFCDIPFCRLHLSSGFCFEVFAVPERQAKCQWYFPKPHSHAKPNFN